MRHKLGKTSAQTTERFGRHGMLCVPVPPESVEISSARGEVMNTVIGAFQEGQTLRLTCRVRGGKYHGAVRIFQISGL